MCAGWNGVEDEVKLYSQGLSECYLIEPVAVQVYWTGRTGCSPNWMERYYATALAHLTTAQSGTLDCFQLQTLQREIADNFQ